MQVIREMRLYMGIDGTTICLTYVKMAIRRLSSSTLAMRRYAAVRNGTSELNPGQMSPFSLNRVPFILGAIVHSEDDPGK